MDYEEHAKQQQQQQQQQQYLLTHTSDKLQRIVIYITGYLRRLCTEQSRLWHRYVSNPLLFAYRKVSQEYTGFSPFELLYGRAVRGPMFIPKELWTKELGGT